MSAIKLNERSLAVVRRLMADSAALGVAVENLPGGAVVVDAGLASPGSLEAGRLMAEACLGGLGRVELCELPGDIPLMGVKVWVSLPELSCMASQYAGWPVSLKGGDGQGRFFAMGSGPARVLRGEEPLLAGIGHEEAPDCAVLILEGRDPPSAEVAAMIAKACGVDESKLFLVAAPTASLAGSVQIAARVVETGMHKLHELGFPLDSVRSGFGTCPLAPVAADDLRAIGRTNDAMLYGAKAWYTVDCEDHDLSAILARVPSMASRDYGTLFYDLFQRYQGDFYKIDPMLFSPAWVFFTNVKTGRSFQAGKINPELLRRSFGL